MAETVSFENSEKSSKEINNQSTSTKSFQFTKVPEERFNTASHFLGGILMTIGTIFLIFRSEGDQMSIFLSLIYGLSNAILFFSSTICHSKKLDEDQRFVWSTVDQIAIYLMIAGTYTPITYFFMTGNWLLGILLGQWIFAGIGIILKIIKPNSPRWITAGIYLIQGWMLIPAGKILFEVMPANLFALIIAGGLFYSIGTVFYITKKPRIIPGVFGGHEIWHICVLLGALSFYLVVFQSI
ncbi:MAG: PAQR family membrane homeostasis protein TrhA [Promethearchaeota archaeon]